jgi:Zn-finger nucleic acid-binding protein
MDCPNCLERLSAGGINVFSCLYCNGSWLKGDLIHELIEKNKNNPSIKELQSSFEEQAEKEIVKNCPDCINLKLNIVHVHNVEVDFCNKCHGVFFDEGEMEKIFKLKIIKKPKEIGGGVTYVAAESLFWIIAILFGGF